MKKLKGFTLIELIVVIAILGVLVAILVPAMLGYMRKSKISSANSDAASIMKAVSIACSEFDEEEIIVPDGDYVYSPSTSALSCSVNVGSFSLTDFSEAIDKYIGNSKGTSYSFTINQNVCLAVASKSGTYYGSKPVVLNNKNYQSLITASTNVEDVLDLAKSKYNTVHNRDEQI